MKKIESKKQKIDIESMDAFRVRTPENKVMVLMTAEQYEEFLDHEKLVKRLEDRLAQITERQTQIEVEYERIKKTCKPFLLN